MSRNCFYSHTLIGSVMNIKLYTSCLIHRERRNKEVVFSRCQGLQPSTAPCRTNYNITCPKMSRGHIKCACVGLLSYGGCRVTIVTCMSLKLHLSLITYLHTTVHTVLRITWHFPCLFLMHHHHCSIMTYISKCIYLNNPNLGLSDHCLFMLNRQPVSTHVLQSPLSWCRWLLRYTSHLPPYSLLPSVTETPSL